MAGNTVPLFPPKSTDRQPPHAAEAEISVLGACIMDESAIGKVVEIIDDSAFYRESHRRIFRAMLRLTERGEVVDPTTVAEELKRTDEVEQAGGLPYLADLMDAVPTAANVEYHARIVEERATLRRLIEVQSQGIRDCYDPGERTVAEILDAAEAGILSIASRGRTSQMRHVKPVMREAFERIDVWQREGGVGVPTGFRDVDDATGGLERGDLIILAARPSMGKTAMAVQMALSAAYAGRRVPFFSFEMSEEQLVNRMLCTEAMVDSKLLKKKGGLDDDAYRRLATASSSLYPLPIWFDKRTGGGVLDIRAKARRLRSEHGDLGLIVVDYLQLMAGSGQENRQQEVTAITRGLKTMAGELDVPVLALSQLSRNPEARTDKRPQLSDLRESGAIEQDADVVLFLYRPEYYLKEADAEERGLRGVAELIIGKQRNGPTRTIELYFREQFTRFEDATHGGRPGF